MREDMYAESGVDSFAEDTSREKTPRASNHRWQIRKLDPEEVREMLRNVTRMLKVAIDVTKGHPWYGEVETDEEGDIAEDYILGYKDGELYHQWATVQVVGFDIPLVLDALPIKRGMKREDIVDELLSRA